jgi:putative ABC transport system ATP-binding protein
MEVAEAPGEPLIDGRELYRFFHIGDDETFALRGVSVCVRGGELVAVIGPSGSGKSTLLACLAGLDEPDGGHVMIAGQRISRRDEATRARLRAR